MILGKGLLFFHFKKKDIFAQEQLVPKHGKNNSRSEFTD